MKQALEGNETKKEHKITRSEALLGLFCVMIWFGGCMISYFIGFSPRDQFIFFCLSFLVAISFLVIGIWWMMRKEKSQSALPRRDENHD